MFVQVIRARVSDPEAMVERGEVWHEELRPGAEGYLGTVAGTTPDGEWITVVRFESTAAAVANSTRPEQTAWWEQTAKLFVGEPTFLQGEDTDTLLGGPSTEAGFVQVMVGRTGHRSELTAMEDKLVPKLQALHPALLGSVRLWVGDRFVDAIYFTSEAEARQGEAAIGADPDVRALMEQLNALGDVEYLDLPQPYIDEA